MIYPIVCGQSIFIQHNSFVLKVFMKRVYAPVHVRLRVPIMSLFFNDFPNRRQGQLA